MDLNRVCKAALAAGVLALSGSAAWAVDLPGLLRETLEQHPGVVSARQQQAAAAQDTANARWQYFPTPSVSVQQGNQGATATLDSKVRTASLQQPLWTAGRLGAQVDRALANEQVSAAALEEVRQDLALRVLSGWSSVQSALLRLTAFQKSLDTHDRLLKQVVRRRDEGASADSDVMLARSRMESVRADVMGSRIQLETALEQLSQLTGRKVQAHEVPLHSVAPLPERLVVDMWVGKALERAPSLTKAQARVQAQTAELAIAQASLWPEVFARIEKKHGDVNQYRTTAYIGMEASLGAGLSKQTAAASAQARLQSLQSDVQSQQRTVTEQVRSDFAQWVSASQRSAMLASVVSASENVAESWSRQFLSGRKSWQEVMNAAREQAQNEVQLSDVQAQALLLGKRLVIYADGVDALVSAAAVKGN
jgi:outer membrane protein, adhesin transport system